MGSKKITHQKDSKKDFGKDKLVRALSALLLESGFTVRREELKRGPGWKTVSGTCRLEEQRLIFVDKRMPLEEQVAFLLNQVQTRNISLPEDLVRELHTHDVRSPDEQKFQGINQ